MSPRLTSRSSVEADRHRHRRRRFLDRAVGGVDRRDRRRESRRQHHDLVARLVRAARDLARVAAVVVVPVVARPDHVLHGEPAVDEVAVGADVHLFEVVQQARAFVPGHVVGAVDDVVALQRRHRDEREVVHVELGREVAELVLDALEHGLVVVDEVHLVDAQHEVGHAEQRREERVPARLLEDAVARVDEDEREVRRWTRR